MKSTKIVATIGPASDKPEMIKALHEAGMNVARLNFSHGNYEYFSRIIDTIRQTSDEIAIMLDTKGPEIRTRAGAPVDMLEGTEFILSNAQANSGPGKVNITYENVHLLEPGNRVLFDDGLIEAEILERTAGGWKAVTLNSGMLLPKKSVAFKGHNPEIEFLSQKDTDDIKFGVSKGIEFVAASFVRKKEDVLQIQKLLEGTSIKIISKIEHWQSIENISDIVHESFGIMVARGDLGVEVSLEKVPEIQMEVIKQCNRLGRPVIVATQMLESMKENPRPTRAEVSDVALAIVQGADAVMLSAETASGKYPVKAVEMMSKIAREYDIMSRNYLDEAMESFDSIYAHPISLFVTRAAYLAQKNIGARAILTPTESGYTARKVSRFKPKCMIIALTRNKTVFRQLGLSWGVLPLYDPREYSSKEEYINDMIKLVVAKGLVSREDKIIVTAGHKMHIHGHTNHLGIYEVSDMI